MKFCLASFLFLPLVVIAADTNDMPVLVPAYAELPSTFWEQHQTAIIIAGFAFLTFIFLFVKTMLRPESQKILVPEMVARQALAKLQGLPEDGKLLSEVSQILRHYFSAAFELPVAELTTAEFCTVVSSNAKVGQELARSISSFLRECDERKFSSSPGVTPINAVPCALEFVSLAEKRCAELRATTLPPR